MTNTEIHTAINKVRSKGFLALTTGASTGPGAKEKPTNAPYIPNGSPAAG